MSARISHLLLVAAATTFLLQLTISCTEESQPTTPTIGQRAPDIWWESPAAGSSLSDTVRIRVRFYDESGVDSVRLFKDGAAVAIIFPPYASRGGARGGGYEATYLWDTTADSDGVHIWEARAWDAVGNTGVSPALLVRVKNTTNPPPDDRTPPTILWLAPEAGSTLQDTVMLMLMLNDNVGVDSVQLLKDGAVVDIPPLRSSGSNSLPPLRSRGGVRGGRLDSRLRGNDIASTDTTLTYLWDTAADSDGVHIWEARAWDAAGNAGVSPALLVKVKNHADVNPDTKSPVVVWLSPEAGSRLTGLTVLRFQAIADNEVDSVQVYLNGAVAFQLAGHSELNYEAEWNTEEWEDGLYNVEVRATDAAGNAGILPAEVTVTVANHPADTTPPDVWWVSPDGGATLQDTVTLRLRVYDESGVDSVHLLKDGTLVTAIFPPYGSGGGVRGGEFGVDYLWDTRADSDGVHLLSAVAWDSSGNEGVSQTLLVKVQNNAQPPAEDHTPPVIVWLSPEPGDTVEGTVFLQFEVLDDDWVDSVKVYLDGRMFQTFANSDTLFNYEVQWATDESEDGNYIFQVKAWDRSLNVGLSEVVWFHVWNNRPRVIWVPDEYETIQGAINASTDGDTVRVRAGTYSEGVSLIGKSVWLESEDGPEETTITGTDRYTGVEITNRESNVTIRGFMIRSEDTGIWIERGCRARILNCIIKKDWSIEYGIIINYGWIEAWNCIVDDVDIGILKNYAYGRICNCIIINCDYGLTTFDVYKDRVEIGWNLFWQNQEDYHGDWQGRAPHFGDVFANPGFAPGSYRLSQGSPAIDAGNPDIIDSDGSRSDLGVYGGPYAY